MDDLPPFARGDPDVPGFRPCLVVKVKQISHREWRLDGPSCGELQVAVTRDCVTAQLVRELRQAGAVNPPRAAPAPEIVRAGESPSVQEHLPARVVESNWQRAELAQIAQGEPTI